MSKLTHKTFTALLHDINKGTTERRAQIQDALEFAAYCAQADRNADPAIRLFAVVGRETNRQNMATWLSDYAPIGFKDGTPFFHEKKWKLWTGTIAEFETEVASSIRWWNIRTPASEVKDTVDVAELLRQLVKSVEAQIKANGNPKSKRAKKEVKHADMLAEVSALLNNHQY